MKIVPGWLCLAAALLFAAPALAKSREVDAAHSTLTFTNTYQNVSYTGQFKRFTAKIDYDPNDLAHAKFDVSVDITSLDTQNAERDHTALGADFFDTAKFPRARFVTTSFHKSADGKVIADGTLTLRGISKPVALDVRFSSHGDTATLDVTARLKRLDFGIGAGQWADPSMIGNEVSVHGHLQLHGMRTAGRAMPDDRFCAGGWCRPYRLRKRRNASASNGQPSSRPDASSCSTGTRTP